MTDPQINDLLRRHQRDDRVLEALLKGMVVVALVLVVLTWVGAIFM